MWELTYLPPPTCSDLDVQRDPDNSSALASLAIDALPSHGAIASMRSTASRYNVYRSILTVCVRPHSFCVRPHPNSSYLILAQQQRCCLTERDIIKIYTSFSLLLGNIIV